jgi:hypothetical protein
VFFHGILPRTIGSTMGIYLSYHGDMGMKVANYWEQHPDENAWMRFG